MTLTAAVFGLVIGLVLGGLGGGGGVLTVPALVYGLGESAQSATTTSLVIVGLTALAGALSRIRGGTVRWRTGLLFGAAGVPAALLGSLLNRHLDQAVLLMVFAVLIVVVAVLMLAGDRRREVRPAETRELVHAGGVAARPAAPAATSELGATMPLGRVLAAASVVGFLTGLLGVGGGFLVVPTLAIPLRLPMPIAIGTSLVVIAVNSGASLAARAGAAELDWRIVVPFTLAAVLATAVGKRVADRFSGRGLTRAFAALLLGVAGFVAVQSALALS